MSAARPPQLTHDQLALLNQLLNPAAPTNPPALRPTDPVLPPAPPPAPADGDTGWVGKPGRSTIVAAVIGGIFTIVGVFVTGTFGMLTDKGDDKAKPAIVVTDCPKQQQDAIDVAQRNPGRKIIYSGPSQEQCHLNEAVQAPRPGDVPTPPK